MNSKLLNAIAAASAVLLMATSSWAQSAYSNAVMSLSPVGYWPMHETETAAPGDLETNYGSAGSIANGYYCDWVTPSANGSMVHGWPSGIAGDSDPSMNFNCIYPNTTGNKTSFTNTLIIPQSSRATALVPPFTVEVWYFFTNNINSGRQSDLWASVNAGGSQQGLNGVIAYSGIRLFFNNTLAVYSYANNTGVNSAASVATIPFGASAHWTHIVTTMDAFTNINVYLNGVDVISNYVPPSGYAPNYYDPFEIDNGKGFTRDASGYMDEFAIYTNALSGLDISNHYATGINPTPPTPYNTLVLNDNPSIYYRMDSPTYGIPAQSTLPALTNYGSAAVNGFYEPGVPPSGAPGPNNGLQFAAGFGANANAMPGNGLSSYADAGNASVYNPTGTNAFSISAWFKGDYCDSRTQTIVGHGSTSWGLVMTTSGQLQCQLGTNTSSLLTSAKVYNDSFWHQAVVVYTPASTPGVTGTNALYVDGVLDSLTNGVSTNGIGPGTNLDVMIGSDAQFTNNPVGFGRQFAGNICEVALFTNALAPGQIQTLYNAGEMPPTITTQPLSATSNQGSTFTNSMLATGALPLAYQWYTNGVALVNQTNASLILNPVQINNAGTNYYVIVTNLYGSATSAVVSLTVNSSPTITANYPVTYTNLFTLYAGANPAFSVVAGGALPLYYRWYTNGVLNASATNASLTLTNVPAGSLPNYFCVVSNFVGSTTSFVWNASVVAVPAAPYPVAVLALNPLGYWRLNDGPDDGNGDINMIANDYAGGNDGLYNNASLVNPGYNPTVDPSDTSVKVGAFAATNSYASQVGQNVDFKTPVGSNAKFSVEAWVSLTSNSSVGSPQGSGLVCKGAPNGGEEFALDVTSGGPFRFFVRSASGTQYSATGSGTILLNTFYHLVGVCDEANSNVLLYVNGVLVGQTTIPPLSGINSSGNSVPMTIGSRSPNPAAISQQAFGYLNDVALFNYALSSNQVVNEYLQSGIAPTITQQPLANTNINPGGTLVAFATATGTTPLSYQWYDVNATNMAIAGQTNATLVVSNILVSDSYYLTVSNPYGATNSTFVNAYVGASIISQYPYTNLLLYAGANAAFSVTAGGVSPLSYFWFTNGVLVGGATNASYTQTNVQASFSNYCIVSNVYGMATSAVWAVTIIPAPTAPYPVSVLAAHPIGYWRLNEGPDNGSGDQGVVANDYVGGHDGIYTNVNLAEPGYTASKVPNTDPTITSTLFGETGISFYDSYAGQIAGIDFSATNASATFTIEAWVNGFSSGQVAGGLVSKGYGAGGEQFDLDLTSVYGLRFLVRDAAGTSHGISSTSNIMNNAWHHVVGVCDEVNSNVSLYIDGSLIGSVSVATKAGILSTTWPMVIGSRTSNALSNANLQFYGYMNDVAVYNYALTPSQVAAQYSSSGGIAPFMVQQPPTNAAALAGSTLTVSGAAVAGTLPLTNQWWNATLNSPVAGQTNSTLIITNISVGLNGDQLYLASTNAFGSTNSVFVTLTISSAPPTVGITNVGNGHLQLSWTGGTLLSSTNVLGPYTTNLTSGLTSPYTVPATNTQQYYRVRFP